MKSSPVRMLAGQRACLYLNSSARQTTLSRQTCTRSLSTSRNTKGPFSSSYGSSEFLKRRYQPTPSSIQVSAAERAKAVRRIKISFAGIIICAACMFGVISSGQIPNSAEQKQDESSSTSSHTVRYDAPPSIAGVSPSTSLDEVEQIPTGTSTIPTFPKTIHLSSISDSPAADEQEYQLMGLGIRTVSFLGVQVYVVGLYIAVPDIASLQEHMMRVLDPVATTLVPGERSKLRDILLDPEKGEEVWNSILKDAKLRTAIRIVPTRNTDFQHLRDGFVRGLTARSQSLATPKKPTTPASSSDHTALATPETFTDDAFGTALSQFKALWGGGARKNVPKSETLLLTRDARGNMAVWVEDKKGTSLRLGGVEDERISRLIWLCYLGGKNVSSEGARKSVVDGVMDFVERPVGTVATQVV